MTPFKAKGVLAAPLRPLSMMFLSLLTLARPGASLLPCFENFRPTFQSESTYREAKAGSTPLIVCR